jgi:resuscitation-promoting factor RpfA
MTGKHSRTTTKQYVGRHRAPENHTLAKVGTVTALSIATAVGLPTTALADPPGGWGPIIQCESGDRNVEHGGDAGGESTASGYFQFVNGTWRLFGGAEFAPRAIQASKAEQTIIANRAFARNGLRDWEASRSCWQKKIGAATAPSTLQPSVLRTNKTITVKSGDTLSKLFDADWERVYQLNRSTIGNNPNLIRPGQTLRL